MNILLLEDVKSHASLFNYALEDLGWREKIYVKWAQDIESAIDMLEDEITLMLVDYKLEDNRFGTEFCRIARERKPNAIILIMSSMDDWDIYVEAYEAGINAFIPKFEDFDELLDQLNCILHYYENFWLRV
ncbi:MAG: response regulator [Bacteroidota bacterium]